MDKDPVRRRLPGYATELLDFSDGTWEVKAHDLGLLVDVFGENLLWGLARCFEASDRLMSLGFLIPDHDAHQAKPIKAIRDHFTAFWLAAGTMRELALAILNLPGMRKRLTTDEALRTWYTLFAIAKRWNSDTFTRVRNAIAFHLDTHRELFQRGFADLLAEGQPLVLAQGDTPEHGHSRFPFGYQIFIRGLWPEPTRQKRTRQEIALAREHEFKAVAAALARDQPRVGELLQGLLVTLLREGRAITPEKREAFQRARLLAVLRQRA